MLDKILNAPIIAELKNSHLFNAMDSSQFDEVLKFARLKSLKNEQMLFQQGEDLTYIYYLYDGAVKLFRSTRNGNEKIIEVVQSGRPFAEGVLFVGAPKYPVSSIAMKTSVLVQIDAKKYLTILQGSTKLCLNMLGHLSQRLHWMIKEIDNQTLHNASFRIVDYFLSQVSHEEHSAFDLCLTIPKRDIASRLSIKPETFSRALKTLLKKELININDNHIILKDVEKLRKMVELEEI